MRTSWKVRATPARAMARARAGPEIICVARQIAPRLGRSAPEIRLITVVLPEPLGPIRPSTSFSRTSKLSASTATRPPKRLVTACSSSDRCLRHGCRAARGRLERRLDAADHAVRNQVHDEQEGDAEQQHRLRREARRDHLPQDGERDHADQRPPQPVRAAEQRHDHDLEGKLGGEGDRRLDVGVARRHHRADHAGEHARDHEQRELACAPS